jgi:hypothetical protein
MIDKGALFCPRLTRSSHFRAYPSILKLETPPVEEIARAIWRRQHDLLASDAISRDVVWRDQSIPSKFWDEFLLDAHAVLSLLCEKHMEDRNEATVTSQNPSIAIT